MKWKLLSSTVFLAKQQVYPLPEKAAFILNLYWNVDLPGRLGNELIEGITYYHRKGNIEIIFRYRKNTLCWAYLQELTSRWECLS